MHEMGIANSILDAVKKEAARYPGAQPRKVGVKIGELTAVDPEALRFCFEVLVQETEMDGLELKIEICPRLHQCLSCSVEFPVRDYDFVCPHCGSLNSKCISGDELQLAYLEIDEHEPSTV
jgi:hydrogenase nickel incorporation protein HypA/HybF